MTLVIHVGCISANLQVCRKQVKLETYKNCNSDVKLAANSILSSASHSPGEGSTVGKPERRPFGIPTRRLKDNIKMDI
jgi:hypothetical protein